MDRRRANVSNYGIQWLKPPGVPKTLFQMREERREAEEHAEAMRREEMMAAQLAEAAAEEDEMVEGEEEVDLDEDVPEAEGFGFDGEDSEGEEETMTESEEEEEETENNAGAVMVSPAEEAEVRHMRAAEDRLLGFMARGEDGASDLGEGFGGDGAGEEREDMLEEDDLVHMQRAPSAEHPDVSMGMDMDLDLNMDADLDGEIPEGDEDEYYEHTDSDEEVDESTRDISFAGRSSGAFMRPLGTQPRRSVHRSSLRSRGSIGQSDMDISGLLSGEGSSFMESSPHLRRRG